MLRAIKNVFLSLFICILFCSFCLLITTAFAIDTSPNSSYFADQKWGLDQTNILGNKTPEIIQRYQDRMRSYELDQAYGLNGLADQYNYYSMLSGFHTDTFRDLYRASYSATLTPYLNNARTAQTNGQINQGVTTTGGAVAVLMGQANTVKLSDTSKIDVKTDVANGYSELKYTNKSSNAFINYNTHNTNDPSAASLLGSERCQGGLYNQLYSGFNSSATYGGTSHSFKTSLDHSFLFKTDIGFDEVFGNNYGIATESRGRIGYGITF